MFELSDDAINHVKNNHDHKNKLPQNLTKFSIWEN